MMLFPRNVIRLPVSHFPGLTRLQPCLVKMRVIVDAGCLVSGLCVDGLGLLLSTAHAFFTPCRFMEFEAEEMQIQNTQLMNGSPGLSPVTPLKLDPGPLVPEACQQPGKATHKPDDSVFASVTFCPGSDIL